MPITIKMEEGILLRESNKHNAYVMLNTGMLGIRYPNKFLANLSLVSHTQPQIKKLIDPTSICCQYSRPDDKNPAIIGPTIIKVALVRAAVWL